MVSAMAEVTVLIPASAERIFAVLADGWSYGHWVVGSTHMRDVDPDWPRVGTRIEHSIGAWPLMVQDATTVLSVEPPRLLELEARFWPFGRARIRLELHREGLASTRVRMVERVSRGPAHLIPAPLQALLLGPRNRESLTRLTDLATSGYGSGPTGP
ncbi:SRPBCC family protein [Nocardia sp. NPDC005978]|uniref:SRPBCC family protein n=1 Tax=Nocardia sp. NPDC005978 TaxID=3156725 RepID=UPI0033BD3532